MASWREGEIYKLAKKDYLKKTLIVNPGPYGRIIKL